MSEFNDGSYHPCAWDGAKGQDRTVKQITIGLGSDADLFFFVTRAVVGSEKRFQFVPNERLLTDYSDEAMRAFVEEMIEVMESNIAALKKNYLT